MPAINRTIIVEADSRYLTHRVIEVLEGYDDVQAAAEAAAAAAASAAEASTAAQAAATEAADAATEVLETLAESVRVFPSVSALVASTDLEAGQMVRTVSYYADGEITDPSGPIFLAAAGVSNNGLHVGATGGRFPSNSQVYMWLSLTDGGVPSWVQNPNFETTTYYLPMEAPMQSVGGGRNCPGLQWAHRMAERSGRPVYLIEDARGGRPISDWIGTGVTSIRYANLRAQIVAALAAAGGTRIDGLAWIQGEYGAMTSPEYQAALNTLSGQLTAEPWWTADTVMIAGEPPRTNPTYDGVRAGINAWAAEEDWRRVASSDGLEVQGDNIHYTGAGLYVLGALRYWAAAPYVAPPATREGIGGATYRISADSDPADGFGEHILANGLRARLAHDGELRGEWWGMIGVEASARFDALLAYAAALSPTGGNDAEGDGVSIIQRADFSLAHPVVIGGGAYLHFLRLDMEGVRIDALAGGSLDASNYMLDVDLLHRADLKMPVLNCNGVTNGARYNALIRTDVRNHYAADFHTDGLFVEGICSDTIFWAATGQQHRDVDGLFEMIYTGSVIRVAGADFWFQGGNPGRAKYCYKIDATASQVRYSHVHPFGGNGTNPRTESVLVYNEGGYRQQFSQAYFDNGLVIDMSGQLVLESCYHFLLPGAGTWTHPLTRVRIGASSQNWTTISDCFTSTGYFEGTDPNTLVSWGPASSAMMQRGRRVEMGSTEFRYVHSTDGPALVEQTFARPDAGGSYGGLAYDYIQGGLNMRHVHSGGRLLMNPVSGAPTDIGVTFNTNTAGMIWKNGDNGSLWLLANGADRWTIRQNGDFRPAADNAQSVGTASFRASVVYAGTGAINTSDANQKEQFRELSEAEAAVAVALKGIIRAFKFRDAVALKGDGARWHFGVMAQDVAAAFSAEGLDAEEYGLFCRDTLEDGTERLGVRYDELAMFILGAA